MFSRASSSLLIFTLNYRLLSIFLLNQSLKDPSQDSTRSFKLARALCENFTFFLVPGQVMTAQAAVEAVLSAATPREDTKQANCEEESVEGEPQTKRQALGMDFTSLVKEVVFDDQQVPRFEGVLCARNHHVPLCKKRVLSVFSLINVISN